MKLAAALVLAIALGCVSPDAQLWAAVDTALPTIRAEAGAAADPLVAAVRARDEKYLLVHWMAALNAAWDDIDRRVAAGELDEETAASLRETLRLFGDALVEIVDP